MTNVEFKQTIEQFIFGSEYSLLGINYLNEFGLNRIYVYFSVGSPPKTIVLTCSTPYSTYVLHKLILDHLVKLNISCTYPQQFDYPYEPRIEPLYESKNQRYVTE